MDCGYIAKQTHLDILAVKDGELDYLKQQNLELRNANLLLKSIISNLEDSLQHKQSIKKRK